MEPISAIAISFALGAGATAGTEVVKSVVKDAYETLKAIIKSRYPTVATRACVRPHRLGARGITRACWEPDQRAPGP